MTILSMVRPMHIIIFYDHLLVECEKGLLNYGDKLIVIGDLNSNVSLVSS